MKAALALVVIYLGMFFVAIQGGPSASVQAAPQYASAKLDSRTIDPAKEADIRSLLELVGARDQLQDSVQQTAEQYREKLLASLPRNDKEQVFVNAVITDYEKKYDVDRVNEELVALYDRHYTDEEIKGLLQFYGSPLGQKVAAESPKIFREIQQTTRAMAGKTVRDALQQAKQEDPGTDQNARISDSAPRRSHQQRRSRSADAPQQAAMQQTDQP